MTIDFDKVIAEVRNMKKLIQIVVGNIFIAFALSTLVLENSIIAGGVSGLGSVLHYYLGLLVSAVVGMINVTLFIIGFLLIGKEFAMKTLLSTFLFPVLLEVFNYVTYFRHLLSDSFFACILAGVMIGYGVGMIIKAGGSTGGFDIIALLVEKYFHVPVSLVFNAIDLSILLLQFSFHSPEQIIYGIVTVMLTAYMMNYTLMSGKGLAQIMVMSDKYSDIQDAILTKGNAGVTMLEGIKGYTNCQTQVLLSVIPYRKVPLIKEIIKRIDEKSFIIVSRIEEVGGNGFTREIRDQETI